MFHMPITYRIFYIYEQHLASVFAFCLNLSLSLRFFWRLSFFFLSQTKKHANRYLHKFWVSSTLKSMLSITTKAEEWIDYFLCSMPVCRNPIIVHNQVINILNYHRNTCNSHLKVLARRRSSCWKPSHSVLDEIDTKFQTTHKPEGKKHHQKELN